jgi:prepilin-type N-terminal cleavage/methylation domain-containing protein
MTRIGCPRRLPNCRGFTLLELLLTLSLAVVLMTLVNSAFQFYVGQMDSSDQEMQRTMLATAVMQMIEDDLRATLHPEPLDTSALENLLAKTAAAAGGGGGGSGGGAADAASDSDEAAAGEQESGSLVTTIAVLDKPGLIGNQFQIQIDTSRLPRLEEYVVMMDADPATLTDPPSDLKTVTYFVQQAGMIGVDDATSAAGQATANAANDGGGAGGGLVRRVLDRSAQNYAMTTGNVNALNQTGDLLAPEIAAIEFQYWDGLIWQIEWNSDQMGGLPLAVKIQMTMIDPAIDPNEQEPRVFQHVVRLPMAQPAEVSEEDDTMTEEAAI